MTRMIERWFPCAEVTANSKKGWGSGNTEKALFTWFAARPLAQAKAAVICSLLPWPNDVTEQERLCDLVRDSMTGYDAMHDELVDELAEHYPDGASILDPFSGRAMIPLEAARLGVKAYGIDYSPVATLAGKLLADYPLRDWSNEPPLPFDGYPEHAMRYPEPHLRLLCDVDFLVKWIGDRHEAEMDEFYPKVNGKRPWAYLWAVTIPCNECGRKFPLTADLQLRKPNPKKGDPGQSYELIADCAARSVDVVVHDGEPLSPATLVKSAGSGRGRAAVCPFCGYIHSHAEHSRIRESGNAGDVMLVVADLDPDVGKRFRVPTAPERQAARAAEAALTACASAASEMPAVPDERALGSTGPRRYSRYGYATFGDFCNARQTLALVSLASATNHLAGALHDRTPDSTGAASEAPPPGVGWRHGSRETPSPAAAVSTAYARALLGYCSSVLVRALNRRTRGCHLEIAKQHASHIFATGALVPFGNDYVEVGCSDGPGTWRSVATLTLNCLRKQSLRVGGIAAAIERGSATSLTSGTSALTAVVTDPPYDAMVEYSDSSDFFYVWLKRALATSHPEFRITANPAGVQEKFEEAVVKMTHARSGDHRTPEHYDRCITAALGEACRVVEHAGVVTIMFGHDDPEVWQRLLAAIHTAGLVLTGSWPARTEYGTQMGKANIETTLTLACRPAEPDRPEGRITDVEAEIRQAITERMPLWEGAGLVALRDQRMAAYGPAMEAVGRYSAVLDHRGRPVGADHFLTLARRLVGEIADLRIGSFPLEAFDKRTQFALSWTRQYQRNAAAGSEPRWERLTHDMEESDTRGLLHKVKSTYKFATAAQSDIAKEELAPGLAAIDTAFAVAAAGKSVSAVAEVLASTDSASDELLWAVMAQLAADLGDTDSDGDVWTWVTRNRTAILTGTAVIAEDERKAEQRQRDEGEQLTLHAGGELL
ncbi:MAG: DUF1156 domain-containing protein [Acidimicrobiales bacterium]|nr:DUF1156 domain-containing protein [Acidimicrobiales bacterium]MYD34461.1 DUF1156 domain-containing protein [Acidimicrobiales bacterium]MYI09365.1 DUF1156 domain-containing protein [Acidimicrobiales bacterium]